MSIKSTPRRWGLGSKVDADFEARVERFAARERPAGEEAWVPGYVEFAEGTPFESVQALLAHLYGESLPDADARPAELRLVREIRYLTTDPETGIALPMASFMPQSGAGTPLLEHGTPLQSALHRLDKATGSRLKEARRIGLTVVFDLEVIASRLRPLYRMKPADRERDQKRAPRWTDAHLQRALFGVAIEERQLGVTRIGLASNLSPQLASAQRMLQTPAAATPQDYGITQTGRNTIVGIVDFGCDFAHPSFRTGGARQTRSRILALWDQNESATVPGMPPVFQLNGVQVGFGYGRLFERAAIEAALVEWQGAPIPDPAGPYQLLGYHPHDHHYTARPPGSTGGPEGAHGTYVMEAAAGGRRTVPQGQDPATQPCGVASEAEIVFVQVRVHEQLDGRRDLHLDDVLDAVAFIFHYAEDKGKPCVVNLSLNTQSGPHDGDGYFDRTLSTLLRSGAAGPQAQGRSVVIAAGNVPDSSVQAMRWQHITDDVAAGAPVTFQWRMAPKDLTRNVVEIWYDATDTWLQVTLEVDGKRLDPVLPDQSRTVERSGQVCGSVLGSRPGGNAPAQAQIQAAGGGSPPQVRHLIRLELTDVADRPVLWKVILEPAPGGGNSAVRFHAWLERDDNGPSGLSRAGQPPNPIEARDRPCTIGTLSCAPDAIVVGGFSTARGRLAPWTLSGHGASRLNVHFKPDLAAPAHAVTLIRSGRGNGMAHSLARITGTSVAAPFVAGTIACIYELKPTATLDEVRAALVGTAQPLPGHVAPPQVPGQPVGWTPDLGHGRLNPAGVLARFP